MQSFLFDCIDAQAHWSLRFLPMLSGIWRDVLYSLLEDRCPVKMQGTNSYGHNKEPLWTPCILKNEEGTHFKLRNNACIMYISKEGWII